jgi:hypothetical protein
MKRFRRGIPILDTVITLAQLRGTARAGQRA